MFVKGLVVLFFIALSMCKKEIISFITAASLKRDDMVYFSTCRTFDQLEAARAMTILFRE